MLKWGVFVEFLPVAGEGDVNVGPVDLFEESDSGWEGGPYPGEVRAKVWLGLAAVVDFGVVCLGTVEGVGLCLAEGVEVAGIVDECDVGSSCDWLL